MNYLKLFIFKICVYVWSINAYADTHNVILYPNGESYIYITLSYYAPLNSLNLSRYGMWRFAPRCQRVSDSGSITINGELSRTLIYNDFGEVIIEPVGEEAPTLKFGSRITETVKMKVYSRGASVYDPSFRLYCDGVAIRPSGSDLSFGTDTPFSATTGNSRSDFFNLFMPMTGVIKVSPNAIDLGTCTPGINDFEGQFNLRAEVTGGTPVSLDTMLLNVKTIPDLPVGSTVSMRNLSLMDTGAIFGARETINDTVNVKIPCPQQAGSYTWSMTVTNTYS